MSSVASRERISDFKIKMMNEVRLELKTKTVFGDLWRETRRERDQCSAVEAATIKVGVELIQVHMDRDCVKCTSHSVPEQS